MHGDLKPHPIPAYRCSLTTPIRVCRQGRTGRISDGFDWGNFGEGTLGVEAVGGTKLGRAGDRGWRARVRQARVSLRGLRVRAHLVCALLVNNTIHAHQIPQVHAHQIPHLHAHQITQIIAPSSTNAAVRCTSYQIKQSAVSSLVAGIDQTLKKKRAVSPTCCVLEQGQGAVDT